MSVSYSNDNAASSAVAIFESQPKLHGMDIWNCNFCGVYELCTSNDESDFWNILQDSERCTRK